MRKLNKHKETILKVLKCVKTHPTADWIYAEVRKDIPNVSLGTVYRNLNFLSEKLYILKLDYSGVMSRFDGNSKSHPHIVCKKCGKVDDLEIDVDSSLKEKASKASKYKIDNYRLEFSGVCSDCQ